jgi:hypothetical protein
VTGRKSAAKAPTIDKKRPDLIPFVASRARSPAPSNILTSVLILWGIIFGGRMTLSGDPDLSSESEFEKNISTSFMR